MEITNPTLLLFACFSIDLPIWVMHQNKFEGGVGPKLAGQDVASIVDKLTRYKAGETLGPQSALMWNQAAQPSDKDLDNIAACIAAL